MPVIGLPKLPENRKMSAAAAAAADICLLFA